MHVSPCVEDKRSVLVIFGALIITRGESDGFGRELTTLTYWHGPRNAGEGLHEASVSHEGCVQVISLH